MYVSKGLYTLTKPIEQLQQDIYPAGEKKRTLHISFKGIDDSVIIEGGNIKRTGGYGLLHVCGSNIEISRLTLRNAPSFGLAIGQPFARSTNVFINNITIDTTYSHGISLGNIDAKNEDTVLIKHCRFHETNIMNAGGTSNQWGSALSYLEPDMSRLLVSTSNIIGAKLFQSITVQMWWFLLVHS